MAVKEYSTPLSHCLVSYPGHSWWVVFFLCREAVGVFYSPSRLGKNKNKEKKLGNISTDRILKIKYNSVPLDTFLDLLTEIISMCLVKSIIHSSTVLHDIFWTRIFFVLKNIKRKQEKERLSVSQWGDKSLFQIKSKIKEIICKDKLRPFIKFVYFKSNY